MDEPTPTTTEGRWPKWVENTILPYLDEFMLWPVAAALLGHVVILLVPLELALVRGPDPFSMLLTAMLLGLTAEAVRMEWRARGRLGALTGVLVATWLLSLPIAWYAYDIDLL